MATTPKKPLSKKKPAAAKAESKKATAKKKVVSAKASAPALRKSKAAAKPQRKEPAPVLVNAQKPDEKLPEAPFVDRAVDSIEWSMKALLPVAVAVNCKLVDIAQTNMNAGMALARELVGATSPLEMMWVGMNSWRAHMSVLGAQAQELRLLSADLITTANDPIRAHLRRG